MKLTTEEKKELEAACKKYPIVEKIWEEITSYETDVAKDYFRTLHDTIKALSADLKHVIKGESGFCRIMGSEDKMFERVEKLLSNSGKHIEGLVTAKKFIDPENASALKQEPDEGMVMDKN